MVVMFELCNKFPLKYYITLQCSFLFSIRHTLGNTTQRIHYANQSTLLANFWLSIRDTVVANYFGISKAITAERYLCSAISARYNNFDLRGTALSFYIQLWV